MSSVERGVYHYAIQDHVLELVRPGDMRERVVDQAIEQEFLGECGIVIFLTQILQRMRPKYQDRSYRYGLLEAGHIGENGYLAAASLGLGACGVGAFMDDQINEMLGVDGVEEAGLHDAIVNSLTRSRSGRCSDDTIHCDRKTRYQLPIRCLPPSQRRPSEVSAPSSSAWARRQERGTAWR